MTTSYLLTSYIAYIKCLTTMKNTIQREIFELIIFQKMSAVRGFETIFSKNEAGI